ncbi:MAG: hypothetical protein NVSMB3_08710 [Acidobacteriaceae bacterium]
MHFLTIVAKFMSLSPEFCCFTGSSLPILRRPILPVLCHAPRLKLCGKCGPLRGEKAAGADLADLLRMR